MYKNNSPYSGVNLAQTIKEIRHFYTKIQSIPIGRNVSKMDADPFDEIPKWNCNLFNLVDDVAPYKYECESRCLINFD